MKNEKKLTIVFSIFISIMAIVFVVFNIYNKKGTYSTTNYYLDTVNQITLINTRKLKAEKALKGVDKLILKINNEMSMQLPGSELSKINANAGIRPTKVSDDIYYVIKKSIHYSDLTKDTFDVTVGPLTSLWNIGNSNARVPSKEEITRLLPLVNYKDIVFNDKDKTIFLKKKGMKIDLGGIAKGYCADRVHEYLKENGINDAIINLGGNIFVMGKNKKGDNFVVGIQDPSDKQSDPMGSITDTDVSVVTSGIYERYIIKDGKLYHHMLNPKTGYPFDNNLSSVTIVSKKSIDGDSLSTSLFGLGLEKGLKMANSIDNVEAIFITRNGKVYITNNLKGKFNIINPKYTLAN